MTGFKKWLSEPRLWMVFLLGICSGFPWVIIGSAMTGWLTDVGLTRTAIGFFGSIFFVYTINFLWAPLIDRFRLPIFHKLGDRKSWVVFFQLCIAGLCLAMTFNSPNTSMIVLSVLAILVALASASSDIAIDAFRVDAFDADTESEFIPYAAAAATSGWWTGYSAIGAIPFFLKGLTDMSWNNIFFVLAMFCLFMSAVVFFLVKETSSRQQKLQAQLNPHKNFVSNTFDTVVLPFKDLISRYGWAIILLLLAFLFSFKMGEAFLGRMSITFYKEVGFTDTQIATYSKMVTWWVTIVFSLFGAFLNFKLGIFKGLMIGGIAMAATNLLFALIALQGPSDWLYFVAVLLDGFTSAFATVVLVSFITLLTGTAFSATQYALLASIANFGRTTVASSSGWVVDFMQGDWASFFVLTALMVIPSLLILALLFYLLKKREIF